MQTQKCLVCSCIKEIELTKDEGRMCILEEFPDESGVRQRHEQLRRWSFIRWWSKISDEISGLYRSTQFSARDHKEKEGITSEMLPVGTSEADQTELSDDSMPLLKLEESFLAMYLIEKYISHESLLGHTHHHKPSLEKPKSLVDRVKKMKGNTINRTRFKAKAVIRSERQIKEEKHIKKVTSMKKHIDCLSSEMNACQAILKIYCSKPKVMKATGIQRAIISLLVNQLKASESVVGNTNMDLLQVGDDELSLLAEACLVFLKEKAIPAGIKTNIKLATLEFAGIKFKAKLVSVKQYLNFVQNSILKDLLGQIPALKRIVVCEEMYQFTPDDFKAVTREQKKKKDAASISHLKVIGDIMTDERVCREHVIETNEGKLLISTYLAAKVESLDIKQNLVLDIDSELYVQGCTCVTEEKYVCLCRKYTTPVRAVFSSTGFKQFYVLQNIHQCKGEAELAQIDWMLDSVSEPHDGDTVICIVSSRDIDSLVIHLFSVSQSWPSESDGRFKYQMFLMLQKMGKYSDFYNITNILTLLEQKTGDKNIGIKITLALCLGGNDYFPKFHGFSHWKILTLFLQHPKFHDRLFSNSSEKVEMDNNVYIDFVKTMYCPKVYDPTKLSFQEIWHLTIQSKRGQANKKLRHPQSWMPPETAISKLCCLMNCHIKYLQTSGQPSGLLPDFMNEGCLVRTASGEIEYDLGPDSYIGDVQAMLQIYLDDLT